MLLVFQKADKSTLFTYSSMYKIKSKNSVCVLLQLYAMQKLPVLIVYWSHSNDTMKLTCGMANIYFLLIFGTTETEKTSNYSKTKHFLLANEAQESTMNYVLGETNQ